MTTREKECRTVLNRTGLPADWCANPYIGCSHACAYCYARFMAEYSGHEEPWGDFVDAMVNAPEVLAREITRRRPGRVIFSSVTDPYQPAEADFRLTGSLLEILAGTPFTVTIQTKSDLVLRDLDLLLEIKRRNPAAGAVRVGFSFTTLDERVRLAFEPGAAPVERRFRALGTLREKGLETFAMIAPVLPGLTDTRAIRERLAGLADTVIIDRLNTRAVNRGPIMDAVRRFRPALASLYENN